MSESKGRNLLAFHVFERRDLDDLRKGTVLGQLRVALDAFCQSRKIVGGGALDFQIGVVDNRDERRDRPQIHELGLDLGIFRQGPKDISPGKHALLVVGL